MSRYRYGDLILEALMEFRRPMTMDEVVEYVAEMTDRTLSEVRLSVDNTLTAAWLHGFVERDNDLYSLNLPDKLMSHSSSSSITHSTAYSSNRPTRSHSSENFQWYSLNRSRR
ncbi:uncharacterized protein LOC117792963 [Drosophila innubila]|uniref:uncharacterized protein LOC117792963 n=1 Tax=Drosophila innubila TaxID=198719 RepID=UPI00148B9C0B|nr:uncharacterized protein LOC117792963 [Drosophila innubila]